MLRRRKSGRRESGGVARDPPEPYTYTKQQHTHRHTQTHIHLQTTTENPSPPTHTRISTHKHTNTHTHEKPCPKRRSISLKGIENLSENDAMRVREDVNGADLGCLLTTERMGPCENHSGRSSPWSLRGGAETRFERLECSGFSVNSGLFSILSSALRRSSA